MPRSCYHFLCWFKSSWAFVVKIYLVFFQSLSFYSKILNSFLLNEQSIFVGHPVLMITHLILTEQRIFFCHPLLIIKHLLLINREYLSATLYLWLHTFCGYKPTTNRFPLSCFSTYFLCTAPFFLFLLLLLVHPFTYEINCSFSL